MINPQNIALKQKGELPVEDQSGQARRTTGFITPMDKMSKKKVIPRVEAPRTSHGQPLPSLPAKYSINHVRKVYENNLGQQQKLIKLNGYKKADEPVPANVVNVIDKIHDRLDHLKVNLTNFE